MAKITVDYSKPARTRMAPSPTGNYHVGHIRTVLYNYALAHKAGGQFIFRIEDTDQKRYKVDSLENILDDAADYGLTWDEGPRVGGPYAPYFQTERMKAGLYQKYIDKLLADGNVYRCFCQNSNYTSKEEIAERRSKLQQDGKTAMYPKTCLKLSQEEIEKNLAENKPFAIRIKMPTNEIIEFHDPIRGKMTWNSSDVDDYILVKSNGIPTYHFAAIVDDYDMKITHVFRGMEWIPTTPVHITLAKYLGFSLPTILHLSVLLDPTGKGKMSKRWSGEKVFARYQLDMGYPREAILNYLMFLGWSHPDEKVNMLTLDEFIKVFTLERLQPQAPRFDWDKLDWYGGQYIRKMTLDEAFLNIKTWIEKIKNEEIKQKAQIWKERLNADPEHVKKIIKLLQERLRKYSEIFDQGEFFYSRPVKTNDFDWSRTNHTSQECLSVLPELKTALTEAITRESDIPGEGMWTQEKWEGAIRSIGDKFSWKHADVFMLLRLCIVGSPFSPNLLESMNLIGVEESLERITNFVC